MTTFKTISYKKQIKRLNTCENYLQILDFLGVTNSSILGVVLTLSELYPNHSNS